MASSTNAHYLSVDAFIWIFATINVHREESSALRRTPNLEDQELLFWLFFPYEVTFAMANEPSLSGRSRLSHSPMCAAVDLLEVLRLHTRSSSCCRCTPSCKARIQVTPGLPLQDPLLSSACRPIPPRGLVLQPLNGLLASQGLPHWRWEWSWGGEDKCFYLHWKARNRIHSCGVFKFL